MTRNSFNKIEKNPKIAFHQICWESDVSEKIENWLRDTALGNYKDWTPEVEAWFENKLNRPCIAVSSGTAALHLALRLLNLEPGSEIIMPTLTYAACANVAIYEGLKPIFCDVHEKSWCIDLQKLTDNLHYDAVGQLELGRRFGLQLNKLLAQRQLNNQLKIKIDFLV